MSDKPAAENAAGASSTSNGTAGEGVKSSAPKGAAAEGNPAFRMMGLPRLRARLPSRNWMIFLTVTGGFASAIFYDKYQTRRNRQKWCDLVSHLADEPLPNNRMPRQLMIYLAAPPGDGLRYAREHFHEYVKPVLVAAAMDWDVVEGRKEGDVRHKTAERVRKRRRKAGEGELGDEFVGELMVEEQREKNGTKQWEGVAGDIVIGRNTWKEYIRGLHEGWLGPLEAPKSEEESQVVNDFDSQKHTPGQAALGDAAVKGAASLVSSDPNVQQPLVSQPSDDASPSADSASSGQEPTEEEKEEEKPKPRQPPPYIKPSDYDSATLSINTPDLIGPSVGIRIPHILGFRHTPLRIYRFLNRRHLADGIGRDVASAILASHRPYDTVTAAASDDASAATPGVGEVSEVSRVLEEEEKNWYKNVHRAREPHEESVWVEDMKLDERIAQRMRAFQLTAEDEDRARRIGEGREKVGRVEEDEG